MIPDPQRAESQGLGLLGHRLQPVHRLLARIGSDMGQDNTIVHNSSFVGV